MEETTVGRFVDYLKRIAAPDGTVDVNRKNVGAVLNITAKSVDNVIITALRAGVLDRLPIAKPVGMQRWSYRLTGKEYVYRAPHIGRRPLAFAPAMVVYAKPIDIPAYTSLTAEFCGDPRPGQSALDKERRLGRR